MKKRINDLADSYRVFTDKAYAPFIGIRRKGVFLCNVALSVYIAAVISMLTLSTNIPLLLFAVYQALKLFLICFILSRNYQLYIV